MRELAVGDVLDGYRVEALLARGGMASIFDAVDEASGARVALKVPHLHYEADVVFYERFRREEELALRLDHPNLVRALPPGREKTRVYLVMEYVAGVPLSELLAARGSLPPGEAVDLARQIGAALQYLHAHGIVHRDVKPGNVLVAPTGEAKLLDFGIAHLETARKLTVTGLSASIGTPDYMAPEQLRGRGGDSRADLFALGTMLYLMLSGRLPYAGEDWESRLHAKRLEEPAPLSAPGTAVGPGLAAIVMRAIEPDPKARYATAGDLLADLRDPSAVPSRDPTAGRAPRRRVDVRLVAAVVTIVAALSLVGGVAWLAHRRGFETTAAGVAPPAGAAADR